MADNELDAFLGGAGEPAPEAPPEPAPEPEPQEQEAPEEAPEEAPDEEAPPEPKPGERTVPLAALEKQRRDHKERAAKLEGERDALLRQLEEIKRAQQQPAQPQYQPPQQPIDPVQDPAGYHAQVQQIMLNERLNMSEMQLRREIGAEAVDAAINEFKEAAAKDPSLFPKLYQQPDPYGWLAKQVEVMRFQREVGEDPAAYKARLRAEWEAEQAAAQPAAPAAPAVRLNPSLANVRSAAPRSNGAWAGETPLADILRR